MRWSENADPRLKPVFTDLKAGASGETPRPLPALHAGHYHYALIACWASVSLNRTDTSLETPGSCMVTP